MGQHLARSLKLTLLLLFLITCIIGCDNTHKTKRLDLDHPGLFDEQPAYGKGRYIEHAYQPYTSAKSIGYPIYHIIPDQSADKIQDKITVTLNNCTFSLEEDGSYTERKIPWIEADRLHKYEILSYKIGEDGNEYVLAIQYDLPLGREKRTCVLQRVEDTMQLVNIPSIKSLLNDCISNTGTPSNKLCGFDVTKKGDFVFFFGSCVHYIERNGTTHTPWTNIVGYTSIVVDDYLYTLASTLDELHVYNLQGGYLEYSVPTTDLLPKDYSPRPAVLAKDQDNSIYLQCSKGIFCLNKNTTTFTQVVDGSLSSMSSCAEYPYELYVDGMGNFINVRSDLKMNEWTVYCYLYDPEIATFPENKLSIYSLYDIPEVKMAICKYQNEHPNTYVDYYVAIDPMDDNQMTEKECIQELDAELLTGEGPDIIYLDGLDINDFIEKGILYDIKDEVEGHKEIFDSVKSTFQLDNKIYAIPSRIYIPLVAGEPEALQATGSLQELADYANTSELKLFSGLTKKQLVTYLYQAYKDELYNKEHLITTESATTFIENLKTIQHHSIMQFQDSIPDNNSLYNLCLSKNSLGLGKISDAYSICEALTISSNTGNSLSVLNYNYTPNNIFSINNNSKKKEKALAFLDVILSDDIQEYDYPQSGVAINKNVVPSKYTYDDPLNRGGLTCQTYYRIMNQRVDKIIPFISLDLAKQYLPLYDELSNPYSYEADLDQSMQNYMFRYLNYEASLDQTINDINTFLSIYYHE